MTQFYENVYKQITKAYDHREVDKIYKFKIIRMISFLPEENVKYLLWEIWRKKITKFDVIRQKQATVLGFLSTPRFLIYKHNI